MLFEGFSLAGVDELFGDEDENGEQAFYPLFGYHTFNHGSVPPKQSSL